MASAEENKKKEEEENVSPSNLLSRAKVVAEAAQATLRHDPQNVDKAKAADAAADLLDAGSHYAKVDQSGYGQYVDKAEDYLRQVKSDPTAPPSGTGDSKEGDNKKPTATAGTEPEKEEGGSGGFMKMAQGFLK